jgi:PPOX class probable F420-dependent enzyme
VGPDGRPQLSAVWFLATPDRIRISLDVARQKTKNLQADPAVGLLIFDPTTPMRYLEVRGDAELVDDEGKAFAAEVGAKYGVDLRAFDAPGSPRVVVTIHPSRVVAVDMR